MTSTSPAPTQRDWVMEHDAALATIVSRLPAADTISVSDIAAALNCSRSVVYTWIESGKVRAIDRSGGDKAHYAIFRSSFIEFIKTRIK